MKFFRIANSVSRKVIGAGFPQSITSEELVPFDSPKAHRLRDVGHMPNDVVFPIPILRNGAKVTDLVSTIGISLYPTMSPLLKSILEKYTENRLQWFPIKIMHKVLSYDYWVLNPVRFNWEALDLSVSEIWIVGVGSAKIRDVKVDSLAEFVKLRENTVLPESVKIEKVVINSNTALDIFCLRGVYGGLGFYISEKVMDEILQAGCTGIEFEPVPVA